MEPPRFSETDVGGPPPAGWYLSTIATASWRQSSRDNRMVYLVHALEDVPPPFCRISDCFVLEGASPRGLAYARKRLVAVYRACGLMPRPGDAIEPRQLQGHTIEIEVAHEVWKGDVQLQVVGYRPASVLVEPGEDAVGDPGVAATDPTSGEPT